jgi:hypothetical protein
MPTVFIYNGIKFYFYSLDHEPVHIHVKKGNATAKYNVYPEVSLISNNGFKKHELKLLEFVIEENAMVIHARWKEFFKNK